MGEAGAAAVGDIVRQCSVGFLQFTYCLFKREHLQAFLSALGDTQVRMYMTKLQRGCGVRISSVRMYNENRTERGRVHGLFEGEHNNIGEGSMLLVWHSLSLS